MINMCIGWWLGYYVARLSHPAKQKLSVDMFYGIQSETCCTGSLSEKQDEDLAWPLNVRSSPLKSIFPSSEGLL